MPTTTGVPPLESIETIVWFNGNFYSIQDIKVPLLNHSLHYSGSVFEGEKAKNGKIFKLQEHTARLFESAKCLNLAIPFSQEEIINFSCELLRRNQLETAYVRPLVWRTTQNLLVYPVESIVNVMIAAWMPRKVVNSLPLKLTIAKWIKPAPNMFPVQCKASANYGIISTIMIEAKAQGYDDAIILDRDQYIAECTTSNIFFIQNKQLVTPTIRNCLNGITRQTVISLAKTEGIEVIERDITIDELKNMQGGFTTGTAQGLKNIGAINTPSINIEFETHAIYKLLNDQYEQLLIK